MAMTIRGTPGAAKAPPKQFKTWSFSRWKDYEQCPAFANYKHLQKLPQGPDGPAAARGTAVHKGAEDYLLKRTKTLPSELSSLRKDYVALLKVGKALQVEQMWGFTRQWEPCAWNDWNRVWLLAKMDVHYLDVKTHTLHVDDHKTGRIKPEEHEQQLELYNTVGLQQFDLAKSAHARLLYVDHGKVGELKTPRKDLPKLIKLWERRVQPMFADKRFAPRPGGYCSWCPFGKGKGGPCPY